MLYGPHDIVFVVAHYSAGLFFQAGPYAVLPFCMGKSFPTEIRATGSAVIHCMDPTGAMPCFLSGLLVPSASHVNPADAR